MKSVSMCFVFYCILFANEVGVTNAVCDGDEIKRNGTGVVQIKGGNAKTIDHSWTLKSELMTSLLIVNMTMVNMHSRNRANVSCDFAIEYVVLPDGKQVCHTNKTCGVYMSPNINIPNTIAYQSNEYMKVVNAKCATEWKHATTWPPTLCIQARLTTFELDLNYQFINLPVPSETTSNFLIFVQLEL
nr:uncharacterized protein LOC108949323 [Ciona intestinalis]|eukprot:XP_026689776.1 uncharacterized protein LOC108949323 [Ciona intestinalis]